VRGTEEQPWTTGKYYRSRQESRLTSMNWDMNCEILDGAGS